MPHSGNMSDVSTSASESDSGSISNFRLRTRSGARPSLPKRRRVEPALPIALRPLEPRTSILHQLGRMTVECPHCDALHWSAEQSSASKADSPIFNTCCSNGKVSLPHLRSPPPLLDSLLDDQTPRGIDFRKNLRAYNNALAFASLGATTEPITHTKGVPTFVISGGLYHLIGSLEPAQPTDARKFAQIYFSDPGQELARRVEASGSSSINKSILKSLQIMLRDKNPRGASTDRRSGGEGRETPLADDDARASETLLRSRTRVVRAQRCHRRRERSDAAGRGDVNRKNRVLYI